MTAAVVLPLAVAFAGQVGEPSRDTAERPRDAVRDSWREDAKIPPASASPRLLGLGLATAARCGPELTSPEGLEAQTCVLTQGADTWARTYYRNATGESLDSVLSLLGPDGRSVQMRCVTSADDEPATCETPREPNRGLPEAYTAVDEFARRGADGALLLRSGSSQADAGSNSWVPKRS
ncbi:hypothetical protein A6P39_022090 [Streptomyces sp. FXJ1.172]|uniref:hypothetical protein n=1 Tax=Streptomyces sp. FXJ1.172 TaxID=710705 RepID=UPI0007CF992B|nr:hypothetical protein [Streptomyces sp. FXJ1.172]WEO96509.1 hypothetical protein A6P39_022090 [Streptomyces sp. FXJ1.172]